MSDRPRLLAKSQPHGCPWTESLSLPGHLRDVTLAARQVLEATAEDQLSALGLEASLRSRFERTVLLAAAVHDLGKASEHFQGMLDGTRGAKPQGLRHEWVSVLLMHEHLRDWLSAAVGGGVNYWVAQWAVGGHHAAYGRPSPPRLAVDGAGTHVDVNTRHKDFRACLEFFREQFSLAEIPDQGAVRWALVGPQNVFARLARWHQQSTRVWEGLDRCERRLAAAVKDALVGCDVAGSALPREVPNGDARKAWIPESFRRRPTEEELRQIVDVRRDRNELFKFQQDVAGSREALTFVRAGCGSGKTLAAYHWAATRHPGRRLYFCYPTTGTATEGFRDYLHPPELDIVARLFHGRADVDLDIILEVQGDEERNESDAVARIESLDAWSTPVVSCTVDTVLGLIQNNRRGLYAWPALAGAAFVFDEIHAYDDRLFGGLLRFLEALPGVPVLLMTASLPRARLECLLQAARRRGFELPVISGPPHLEQLPRYSRRGAVDARDPLGDVQADLQRGGKVLWVCNTVDRAMAAYGRARQAGLDPILYHSRFRYEDRVKRHHAVIEAFGRGGEALAVCTQVAEMSLDLSATLLVTDLAPVPALIQRLGRLNRRASKADDPTRPFIVTEPLREDGTTATLPYTPEALEAARRWLGALGEGPLSREGLASQWEAIDADTRPAFVASAWLDGGPTTDVLELREASPGVTVVREEDLAELQAGKAAARLALPMPPPPRGANWKGWAKFKGVPVAPRGTIEYDAMRGGKWLRT